MFIVYKICSYLPHFIIHIIIHACVSNHMCNIEYLKEDLKLKVFNYQWHHITIIPCVCPHKKVNQCAHC